MPDPSHHLVVIAGGDVPPRAALDQAWPGWDAGCEAAIAADSGFSRAEGVGLWPTLLAGDLDSIEPEALARAEQRGVRIRRSGRDKDESDTELGVLEAIGAGATRITVLGALGGPRIDHALANVGLLAHPALAGVDVLLLDAASRVCLLTAPGPDGAPVTRELPGPIGALVSLLVVETAVHDAPLDSPS